ncbi:complexin-2-like isoform X1 [Lampetra planeri]
MDFVMKQALGGATKDVGKMLGGDQAEKDPEAQKKEEDRREALRQQEEERKQKHAKMEAERERVRQNVRDKYGLKRREEREAEAKAAMEAACSGGLTRPKRAIPPGCGDASDEGPEESLFEAFLKYLPGPIQEFFRK